MLFGDIDKKFDYFNPRTHVECDAKAVRTSSQKL